LINADFPRLKKNQLSKDQQKKNNRLADKYNAQGSFPFTVLLSAEGKVIKSWDGYPNKTAEQFTRQIKELVNARN
jgi:thioredoxin-related protein